MLNPRQISVYLYLSLLCHDDGSCHPTTKQIRHDLGIASLTIVFEAISALERGGFILRHREHLIALRSRRNVYRRPSCEFTILRLLESGRIDALLRPTPGSVNEMTYPSRELRDAWLEKILGDRWSWFQGADDAERMPMLLGALRSAVEQKGSAPASLDVLKNFCGSFNVQFSVVSRCYHMEAKAQRTGASFDRSTRKRRGGLTVVPFSGVLDIAHYPIFHSAFAKVRELERPVVLDLTRVTRIDSTFLTELLIVVRKRAEADQPTIVASNQPRVLRLIDLAQVGDRLRVVPSVLEAARALVAVDTEDDPLEA